MKLEKELKINNVSAIFEAINSEEKPAEIVMDDVEVIDGAGMQLIIYLYNQPEKYKIINNSEKLKEKLILYGFNPEVQSEEK